MWRVSGPRCDVNLFNEQLSEVFVNLRDFIGVRTLTFGEKLIILIYELTIYIMVLFRPKVSIPTFTKEVHQLVLRKNDRGHP